jgi:excisionase family DNA binding protein
MENPFLILMQKLEVIEAKIDNLDAKLSQEESTSNADFIDPIEAAEYLNVARSTLYQYSLSNRIKHYKRFGKLYFKKVDLNEFIEAGYINKRPPSKR